MDATPSPTIEVATGPRQAGAHLVEIPFEAPLSRSFALLAGISIGAAMGGGIILALKLVPRPGAPLIMGVCVIAVVTALLMLGRRVARHRAKGIALSHSPEDLENTVRRVVAATKWLQPMAGMHEVVRTWGTVGRVGCTLRVGPVSAANKIEPFTVPFEPQALDEADPAFRQLMLSATAEQEAAPNDTGLADDVTLRRIKRNVALKGGWFIAGVFGLNIIIHAVRSYHERRVTWELALFTVLFVLTLFAPVGTALWSSKQFLAVPGGFIVRKAKGGSGRWRIHLFTRPQSVLCVYRTGSRQWILAVADAEAMETTSGTKRETEFALRAWLSPLAPPSVEQLADLS